MAVEHDLEQDTLLELDTPKKYKVYLLNDDYTTMDFVVDILMKIFHKNYQQAEKIMLDIHKQGQGLCGVYTYEIAETKVMQVHQLARNNGYPLKATMEEE
jgi:ATP-dependent Clp protease adaptor protein ClpS